MKDRLHFLSDGEPRIDFEVAAEGGHIIVTALFYPAADQDVTACASTKEAATVMAEQITGHFDYSQARLRMIRYRDDLRLMTIEDLARFAVPIVPLAHPERSA